MSKARGLMSYRIILGLCVLTLGLVVSVSVIAGMDTSFKPHPMTNASPEAVGQAAVDYTKDQFPGNGNPQVLLVRSVTKQDLPALGLQRLDFASVEDPPLMLVILKGDFGFGNHPGSSQTMSGMRFHYIGYVFDLWAGTPTLTMASPNGGEFRTALNDPTLPIVPTPVQPPTPAYTKQLHYGEVAPTVVPQQKDIEAKAVAAAQRGLMYARLQGQPTSVTSKQMTLGEFEARLDPFSRDPRDKATTVWLVFINGDVQVGSPLAADGSEGVTPYDNMWLLLSVTGDVMSSGAQAPGHALNLSQPPAPLTSWPTAVGPGTKAP